jgi:hypothetical protein
MAGPIKKDLERVKRLLRRRGLAAKERLDLGQALLADGAAMLEDLASAAAGHSRTKSVRAYALAVAVSYVDLHVLYLMDHCVTVRHNDIRLGRYGQAYFAEVAAAATKAEGY